MAAPVYTECNVLWQKDVDLSELLRLAIKLGYERVIINNIIEDLKGGKKEKDKVTIASPSEIKLKGIDLEPLQKHGKFEQLSRLTALLSDASNTHKLSSPEIQAYDILAVQPTNDKTFQLACSTLDVDIITFDLSERLEFRLKRPLLKLAAERGIHFEICYSRAFQDNGVKRQLLSTAMDLVETTKGRAIFLRSPYDVINLAKVIGLNPVEAKNAITKHPRAVVMHAATRKSCKSVVSATMVSQLSDGDRWVLDAHKEILNRSKSDESDDDDSDEDDDEPSEKKIKL